MKRAKCRRLLSAKVAVGDANGTVHTLTMFNTIILNIVQDIPGDGNVKRKLLAAPPLRFLVDPQTNVVYSVQHILA